MHIFHPLNPTTVDKYGPECTDGVKTFLHRKRETETERETFDETHVSRHETSQDINTPFTRYNRFDNRLYRVNKHPTGCHTV